MTPDRRAFLTQCLAGLVAVPAADAAFALGAPAEAIAATQDANTLTVADIASAEKLARVQFSESERAMLVRTLPQ